MTTSTAPLGSGTVPVSHGLEQGSTIRRRFGPAWYRAVSGIHLLKLEGTPYEMGRQHGALLSEVIPRGPIPYYRTYLARMLETSGLGALAPLVWAGLKSTVGRSVQRSIPDFARETLRGMADGSGCSYRELLDGCVMPDSLMWVAARLMRLRRVGPALPYRLGLGLGCTSAIAWGDATTDGKLLHARNFDYHGVSCWPQTTTVAFHEPDEGQRYVSVTAAGVPLGGVTAMNEAGLTMTVHQHMFTDGTRLGGTPIGVVGDLIMRQAESANDAEAILRRHRPIGCWTYLVADGFRREMLCFEENPDRQVAHRFGGEGGESTFGYANIYLDPQLGSTERSLYPSFWRHNVARHVTANQLLGEHHGSLDPEAMAAILADTGPAECRVSAAISMIMTVASVVFSPEEGLLWVATGEAPVSQNAFEPFSLEVQDHAPTERRLREDDGRGQSSAARAFVCYRDAYLAYFDDGDLAESGRQMGIACQLQPKQPLYHYLAGLLTAKSGAYAAAWERFDAACRLGHPHPEKRAAFELWRGRAADVLGRRDDAVRDYRGVLDRKADPAVRQAALRGLKRRFTGGRARRTSIDFIFIDVVAP